MGKWGAVHPETSEHAPTKTFDNHCHALALYFERQRRFPGSTLMMHGTPARVLAQHLGQNLRFKGSPLCDRPRSNSCRHQCRSRQAPSEPCASGSRTMEFTSVSLRRTANNGVHQLSLRVRKIM